MKKYSTYKSSGVEWIGDMPSHWSLLPVKLIATTILGKMLTPEEIKGFIKLPYLRAQNIRWFQPDLNDVKEMWFSPDESKRLQLHRDDLIVSEGGEVGRTCIWSCEVSHCCVQNSVHIVRVNKSNYSKYILYHFAATGAKGYFDAIVNRISIAHLTGEKLRDVKMLVPPLPEQQAIASYLDKKTALIDSTILQKKRLIELLQEERTAIINQAVTRGLDPNVKMKDSGVEWLGQVPEHWGVKKLKYSADVKPSSVDKKSVEGEIKVLLCNYVDVYKNEFISSVLPFMEATASTEQILKFELKKGDVLATKDSEDPTDIAVPAAVIEDLTGVVCGYHLTHIRTYPEKLNGFYLHRLFQTYTFNQQFTIKANGVTRFGLPVAAFTEAFVCLPPLKEQDAILSYIDKKTALINETVSKKKNEILLLHEYRTSLINEVVTGKICVS